VTVLTISLLGDGLRDALHPRMANGCRNPVEATGEFRWDFLSDEELWRQRQRNESRIRRDKSPTGVESLAEFTRISRFALRWLTRNWSKSDVQSIASINWSDRQTSTLRAIP
jgi:hypothetical protein